MFEECSPYGMKGTDLTLNENCVVLEVDPRFGLVELGCISNTFLRLGDGRLRVQVLQYFKHQARACPREFRSQNARRFVLYRRHMLGAHGASVESCLHVHDGNARYVVPCPRSEEHTSELQSLMRTSYAVFCLKKN